MEQIEVRERNLELADDEILVKTHLAGICGQDEILYQGIIPPSGGLNTKMLPAFSYPYSLGMKAGGEIVAVDSKVRDYKPGDKATARL